MSSGWLPVPMNMTCAVAACASIGAGPLRSHSETAEGVSPRPLV